MMLEQANIYHIFMVFTVTVFGVFLGFFDRKNLKAFSYKSRYQAGLKLSDIILRLKFQPAKEVLPENIEPIEYKSFTQSLLTLLELKKEHGMGLKLVLGEIEKTLLADLKFEKRVMDLVARGEFQLIFILLIINGYYLFAASVLDQKHEYLFCLILAVITGISLLGMRIVMVRMNNRFFKGHEYLFNSLLRFYLGHSIGLSHKECLSMSRLVEFDQFALSNKMAREIKVLRQALDVRIKRWAYQGEEIQSFLISLFDHIQEDRSLKLESFERATGVVYFLAGLLIGLPGFFASLWLVTASLFKV